jgi:hypothetical protein
LDSPIWDLSLALQPHTRHTQFQTGNGYNFDAALRGDDSGGPSEQNLFSNDTSSKPTNNNDISALYIGGNGEMLAITQHVSFELYSASDIF